MVLGYLTSYSTLDSTVWLKVAGYDTNATNPNPTPIIFAQSTIIG